MHVTIQNRNTRIGLIALCVLLAASSLVIIFSLTQRISLAAPVPESCFGFDSGTGTINDYNPAADPLCLSDVDIPATIGGTPVTTISSGAFSDDVITSVNFPASISLIESGAFNSPDINLTSLSLDVTGNLLIQDGAFGEFAGTVISISADGNLEYRSNFSDSVLTSFSLSAGGDLLATNASTPISSIGTLTLTATGTIDVNGSALSGTTIGDVIIDGGGTVTLEGGGLDNGTFDSLTITSDADVTIDGTIYGFSTAVGTINVTAAGALNILSGTFSNIVDLTTMSLTAGTGLLSIEDGSINGIATITSMQLTAPSGLSILDGSIASLPSLTSITFPSLAGDVFIYGINSTGITDFTLDTDGEVTVTFGSLGSNPDLTSIDITSGNDLTINNGTLTSLGSLETVALQSGGALTLNGGVLNGLAQLSSVTATSVNDMTIVNGSIYDTAATEVSLMSGGQLILGGSALSVNPNLTTVTLESGSNLVVDTGAGFTNYALESLSVSSGGTTIITDGAFTYTQLSDVVFESVSDMTIGDGTFQFGQISTLNFPASLIVIGGSAFMGNPLTAVTLNSAPTLGTNAFSFAGISYDPVGSSYSNLDQVAYVPLYVTVPHSYTHTIYTPTDIDSDTVDDLAGGYLINPAQLRLAYQDGEGGSLLASSTTVGELPDTTPMLSYRVSENPDQDFDLYYAVGDMLTRSAPAISPYPTPADQTITLSAGLNTISFVYALQTEAAGAPDTGLASLQKNHYALIALGVVITGTALVLGLRFAARTR